ncbi:hypothetical protein CVS30_16145 [Arthrobacter psychrolactophilus]|uniref:PqqD family peptide modification chaperone n=1 Tax=Arthrobacter psychrolactophilus TaxID=92442 RepID=A0A2V5IPL5_9MICC|nr:hypothetical protein [Arthrobacter psychrolactophilus]PYI37342.1 hypothetical protein CVS30_16145 [Arthrobacter psychrolactophilus]
MPGPASLETPETTLEATVPTTDTALNTVQIDAMGVALDVINLSDGEAAQFRQAWSRCLIEPAQTSVGVVTRPAGDFERANEYLTSTITLGAIEYLAGQFMMFHACGLSDPLTGATVAFIAPSGTGKTTVARTLGTDWGYVSDETITVHSDLSIISYPKPLSVKQPDPKSPKLQEGPDSFSLGATPPAPVLSKITLLNRRSESTPVSLEPVPLAAAVLELTPQLSALAKMDRGLVQLCTMIQDCGGVQKIIYSEAATIAGILPDLVKGNERTEASEWFPLELTVDEKDAITGQGLRRTEIQDGVEIDGAVFLLVNSKVLELGPLGALVWKLAESWISKETLLEQVVVEIGDHPAAAELLDVAIEELLSSGVLQAL